MFDKRLSLIVTIFISIFLYSHSIQAQTWTQLVSNGDTLSSPNARASHTAIYDPNNNRMTIFGGYDGVINNDVWILSTANGLVGTPAWTQLFPTGSAPTARQGNTAVYDTTNNRMTIFGGYSYNVNVGYGALNDVWVLSNANGFDNTTSNWTQLFPTGSTPTTRLNHTAIYDSINNRMIIFGGYFENFTHDLNDVWVLSNANGLDSTTPSWTQLFPTGSISVERDSLGAVYDATNNRMIVFGGGSGLSTLLNDVWVLNNANGLDGTPYWTQLFPLGNSPSARYGHTVVYDNTNNRMIIFGGSNGYGQLNDVWVMSNANGLGGIPVWTQIFPAGSTPTTRWFHTAVYDNANNLMTIFGGDYWNGSQFIDLNDVWVLSNADVLPPNLINVPSLKLFINQSLNPAFDLSDYNFAGIATTYSMNSNFLTLSTLTGSMVYQSSYSTATVGTNIYEADNAYGSSTASNKVKYSTYKIYKLPQVGLTVGNSWDVKVGNYTYNAEGLAVPPSFGNPDVIIVSDTSSISATWLNNTVIRIISLQSFSGAVNVDVIASPNATSPFEIDIDKERIQVYTNFLAHGTFSTANDTTAYGLQTHGPFYVLATQSWLSSYTDSAGTQADGVWGFNFSHSSTGMKASLYPSYYQTVSTGQWYVARMRITSDTPNNRDIALLFAFSAIPQTGEVFDVAANIYNGIPSTWTWIETPVFSHTNSTTAFIQFQLKGQSTTNRNVYIDEIQWVQATPELLQARSNTQAHYLYGQFTAGSDTTGWGQQLYFNSASAPSISVSTGLVLNFAGASGASKEGIEWTANNGVQGSGHAYTYPVTPGREIGMHATVTIQSGDFNNSNTFVLILFTALGVQSSGQQSINAPNNIIASAQAGVLSGGEYRVVGTAVNPFYQFQFGIRSSNEGVISINDVDFDTDNDDPNFGDPTLFP